MFILELTILGIIEIALRIRVHGPRMDSGSGCSSSFSLNAGERHHDGPPWDPLAGIVMTPVTITAPS